MDFHARGFAYLELFDPQIALDAWDDVDQYELHRLVGQQDNEAWKKLTPPETPKFIAFIREIEKNMPQCWEHYGMKGMKPKRVEQHLGIFPFSQQESGVNDLTNELIWILVPLIPISRNQGLPTFIEGSHRYTKDQDPEEDGRLLYNPIIKPGCALMFDHQLRTKIPKVGGGVVFARAYDLTKTEST